MKRWMGSVACLVLLLSMLGCSGCTPDAAGGSSDMAGETSALSGADTSSGTEDGTTSTAGGSTGSGSTTSTTIGKDTAATGAPVSVDFSQSQKELFTDRDYATDYTGKVGATITFADATVSSTSNGVQITGNTVVLREESVYVLTGTAADACVVVDAGEKAKVHLVLDDLSLTGKEKAPICILSADKVFITLADGSNNTLANGGSFTASADTAADGALYAKSDLTLNGTGSLTVTSPAGHGIVCKDDLVITGGAYRITSAFHGIDANDSVRMTNASIAVDAGKDGIHAENTTDTSLGNLYLFGGTLSIEAEGDGISASGCGQMADGSVTILTGGGYENGRQHTSDSWGGFMGGGRPPHDGQSSSATATEDSTSMKGIKAGASLLFSGGTYALDTADDAVHADGSVVINGGQFTVATGDDALHADADLTITAGTVTISTSYEGLEAQHVRMTGGSVTLTATDDGINAAGGNDASGTGGRDNGMFGGPGGMSHASNGSIVVEGGSLRIHASGDGMDANGYIQISGGYTVVTGPTQGDTATLDYDSTAIITGGTFIGTGAAGMAQTFSGSENQGVIAVSVGNQPAGSEICLRDEKGNTLLTYTPDLSYAVVILSSPKIYKGAAYTITVGSSSGTVTAA